VETAHLRELIDLEDRYWWHVAKRRLATGLLQRLVPPGPSRVVEGGIGAAGNLALWQQMGYGVVGLDCMPESIQHAQDLGLSDVHLHDLHQPWPVENESSDAVVLLDVLEHLQDPVTALGHAARCLKSTGKVLFTVPAYPMLFSDWDERLGHFRRYTMPMIREQIQQAGMRLEMARYWNSFTLPAALVLRTLRKWRPSSHGTEFPRVSRWMNRCLISAADLEQRLAGYLPIPCGLSIVGVLGK
jgi:SAM-dependent methyltransferase